jgi:hypothetical protein
LFFINFALREDKNSPITGEASLTIPDNFMRQ